MLDKRQYVCIIKRDVRYSHKYFLRRTTMKKVLALIITVILVLSLAACGGNGGDQPQPSDQPKASEQPVEDINKKGEGVMTYAEYIAAEVEADVVVEGYVQAKQSWWNDKASLYLMDADGAYFVYNAACTQDDYAKLTVGTKVKVTGKKVEWSGEIEIGEGAAIEIETGNYVAKAFDATALLANEDELIKHQNEFVSFKGLTVAAKNDGTEDRAFFYNWDNSGDEGTDSDLYFDAVLDGKTYTFVIEYYLCNEESDAYKAVQELKVGDVVDLEGFLYWYNGAQPQVTKLTVA